MLEYKNRESVPKQYCFDLTEFYQNEEEWEKTLEEVKSLSKELITFKGNLKDSQKLDRYLRKYFKCQSIIMDLYVYAMLNHDVDLEKEQYIDMQNRIESFNTDFETQNAFFVPEIVSMTQEEYQNLFKTNEKLQDLKQFLDEIYNQKEHTLTTEEEKIITTLQETFSSYQNISSSLINQDHDYGKIKLSDGSNIQIAANNLGFLKRNPNKTVRKKVNQKFGSIIAQYQNTESALLHNYVKNNINIAKIRRFKSPWQSKLKAIHLSNEVFENLKNTARHGKKAWQDYYRLMKKTLNLKTLHSYDTLLDWNTTETEYTIEEAQNIILEALKPLGISYEEKLKKVFNNHYIDYCGYKGKVNGGYSCSTYTQNSRIVLSFKGKFNDILTIAHEAGHNVHHQYINEENLLWYRHSSVFVAEVASLTNEFLVNNYLAIHGKTKKDKLRGIEHSLKTFQNNFFGAIREGEIEQRMYEHVLNGGTITANFLNHEVEQSLQDYLGKVIENDEYSKLSWVTRSHYYMNFYLFSYAICVVIAASLAEKILKKEKGILDSYQDFLKCGSNQYPEEIYQKLGVDLTDKTVFEQGISYFESLIKLYKKIEEEGEEIE